MRAGGARSEVRGHPWAPVAVLGVGLLLAVGSGVLVVLSWGDPVAERYYWRGAALANILVWLLFVGVGCLILARRPGHLVGWLLAGIGLGMQAIGWSIEYSVRGMLLDPGSLPVVEVWAVLGQVVWIVPFGLLPVLLLVYPTGSLPSDRWRPAVGLAFASMVGVLVGGTWGAWPYRDDPDVLLLEAEAPFGVVPGLLWGAGLGAFFAAVVGAVVSLVVRWRRGSRVERLQIEWLLVGAALWAVVGIAVTIVEPVTTSAVAEAGNLVGLAAIPVAIAVAVLRHRLYEIDRLISRSVTYALVSVVLGAVYATVVVVPSTFFRTDSDLLVAAATLAAVAAFGPVRRRVQAAVDRRFDRSRYDARRVVEAFGTSARDGEALDDLLERLRTAVAGSVQPAQVRVWLREDVRR